MTGPWEIEETDDVAMWLTQLTDTQRDAIRARLIHVLERGPRTGRPYVDHVKGSRFHQMKELRIASSGQLRLLFIFDPRRRCILLFGGDKSAGSQWNDWYRSAIRRADDLYEEHLRRHGYGD